MNSFKTAQRQGDQRANPTEKSIRRRVRLVICAVATLYILGGALGSQPATAVWEREDLLRALKSTVQILVPDNNGDLCCTGSGTVLDAEKGIILTNFHVMGDPETGDFFNDDRMAVIGVMANDLKGAPVLKYLAKVVKSTQKLDLAMLQVVGLVDDTKPAALPKNLGLIAIGRGNSDDLLPGDELAVIGYPGLGGSTVTFTEGVVSGFLDEDQDGVYEWIKTDTEVNPGNSGGLTIDRNGDFVGVPTAGYSRADVAGKISLIRPGMLALDFYDHAALDQGDSHSQTTSKGDTARASGPAVANVAFGTDVDHQNRIVDPVAGFESGVTDIYAGYDYSGFKNGQEFAFTWYLDGESVYSDQFKWQGGTKGTDWVNIHSDKGLPDGAYEVEISLAGNQLYRGGVPVGANAAPSPQPAGFGPITLASEIDDNNNPVNTGNAFVAIDTIYAFFDYAGIQAGAPWRTRWLFNGDEVLAEDAEWDGAESGSTWVSLNHPDGLPDGRFTLELYLDGELSQSASFTVAGRESGSGRVKPINVEGVVHDANNVRKTIAGATIVFLQPGVRVQDWIDAEYDESMVFAKGTSARKGDFRLDAKVTPGAQYSIAVIHDDYKAIQADDYKIPADAEDPYELDVAMDRN